VDGIPCATEHTSRGLKAVPPIRKAIVLLGTLLLGHAWATEPPSGIDACPQIAGDRERLACFDREFALLRQRKPASEPVVAAAHVTAPEPELSPEQAMGLTPGKILKLEGSSRGTALKELTVKIQGVSTNTSGRTVFQLDNGQVWQQVEPDPTFTVRPGDTVHISKGVLGSFFMSASTHTNTRVTRTL
jgi:hypothetical protein